MISSNEMPAYQKPKVNQVIKVSARARMGSNLSAEWQEVNIHDVLERIVSEMTTRIFLGEAFTTNENWIKLCCEYPRNVFGTAMLLRLFPPPLKYLVSQMIPSKFSIKEQMRVAREVLIPVIEKIQKEGKIAPKAKFDAKSTKTTQIGIDDQSVSTLLEWMVANASSELEGDPKKLASRQLILTLASIHTSVMTVFYALFDLLKYPEFIEPLREEILALVEEDGDDGVQNLSKHDLNLLEKMDSFLAEVTAVPSTCHGYVAPFFYPLRLTFTLFQSLTTNTQNPISTVAPQRRLLQTLTLKDGTVLPKGIRIGLPCNSVHFDPEVNESPGTFDGYRLYRRQAKMVQAHKDHLLFGYGRRTCPSRFWAVEEVKMDLVKILIGMDFRLACDGESSKTYLINELSFPDPRTMLFMRAKPKVSDR